MPSERQRVVQDRVRSCTAASFARRFLKEEEEVRRRRRARCDDWGNSHFTGTLAAARFNTLPSPWGTGATKRSFSNRWFENGFKVYDVNFLSGRGAHLQLFYFTCHYSLTFAKQAYFLI